MEQMGGNHGSRAEMIRKARENCNIQLNKRSLENQGLDYLDELDDMGAKAKAKEGTIQITRLQGFFFRLVCAVILYVGIVLISKYDIGNDTFNKKDIQKAITSSEQAHEVEDIVRGWMNQVFSHKDES